MRRRPERVRSALGLPCSTHLLSTHLLSTHLQPGSALDLRWSAI